VGNASYYVSPLDVTHFSEQNRVAELTEVIRDRAAYGCFIIEGKIFPMRQIESEFKHYGFEFETIQTQSISEIRGTPAFKGIATGRVCVINSLADLHRVQEGDVLVTHMTIPEYIPSLKKTVAFVTDEGGITCHAAIVARELKKPCIIATKFATQVFKDGDMVEVDADNGIVRKI
jgi:pyruvate, water dikinase